MSCSQPLRIGLPTCGDPVTAASWLPHMHALAMEINKNSKFLKSVHAMDTETTRIAPSSPPLCLRSPSAKGTITATFYHGQFLDIWSSRLPRCQQSVTVSPLTSGFIIIPNKSFVSPADSGAARTVLSMVILVMHPGLANGCSKPIRIMFDSGLRPDLN